MGLLPASSFQDYCATLTDPRCPDARNSRHPLRDILLIAVCAVMGGAEGWDDMKSPARPTPSGAQTSSTSRMAFPGMTRSGGRIAASPRGLDAVL